VRSHDASRTHRSARTVRSLRATAARSFITGLAYDSRKVGPGACFVALRGSKVDGHDHIEKAIAAGAVAIVAETPPPENITTPWVHMYDTRMALASLSAASYGRPADELAIAGITGTNGKTTIAFLIHHLANQALMRCGLTGHRGLRSWRPAAAGDAHHAGSRRRSTKHLRRTRNHGCRALAMEASFDALHQHRAHGLKFAAAVFTNRNRGPPGLPRHVRKLTSMPRPCCSRRWRRSQTAR